MSPAKIRAAWAIAFGTTALVSTSIVAGEPSAIPLGPFALHRVYRCSPSPFVSAGLLDEDTSETMGADVAGSDGSRDEPSSGWALRAGIGFTLDPDAFLLTFDAPYALTEDVRVGPLLQLAVDDDHVILAPSANVQYVFDLSDIDESLVDLKPFVQGGVGFAYYHQDRRRGDDDDVGFLIHVGFGLEYLLTGRLAVGNSLLFNILPVDALGDHFFFSWQFVTVSFRF